MSIKGQIRESLKEIRESITAEEKQLHEVNLRQKINYLLHEYNARKIALYYPKDTEFNILNIITELDNKHLTLLLPRVEAGSLNFHIWQKTDELQLDDKFHIYQPNPESQIDIPDLVFVPLLAFDDKNHRLGYGGGFYDRVIKKLRQEKPEIKFIGVGHSKLQLQQIPVDEHDEKLDAVIY